MVNTLIETPVDKLVDLIFLKQKILLSTAAKELNLLPSQVEEWAIALKDHKIISINYSLKGMELVANSLTQAAYIKKIKGFMDKKKEILNLMTEIERSILPIGRGQLWDTLKKLDFDTDLTIRRYRYVYNLFSRRRSTNASQELEKQNYKTAVEIDSEVDKISEDLKKVEKEHNRLRSLILKIKEDLVLLEKQGEDTEKIDLRKFIVFLDTVEKQSIKIEKEKLDYLKKLASIKSRVKELRSKMGA